MDDRGHRDHARHTDETPRTEVDIGPDALRVTLDMWGPKPHDGLLIHMERYLNSNWGENPMSPEEAASGTLTEKCFSGHTLQQILEGISFWFTIDGVSRAETHQHVRTRLGCAIMQHGGRDNDWRHRNWRMPETINRAIQAQNAMISGEAYEGLAHCITDFSKLVRSAEPHRREALEDRLYAYLDDGKHLYADLVDAGIPWQDARRVLTIGSETYLHAVYNYVSLRGVLANRLEHVMDWEINCVAQLMLREIRMNCPRVMWKDLGSHSDRKGKAAFAGLDSWPPDGKYPVAYDQNKRTHRAIQMPFFVLTKEAMDGGRIEWIRTNGQHPNGLACHTSE